MSELNVNLITDDVSEGVQQHPQDSLQGLRGDWPDRVVVQEEVKLCHARARLVSYRNFQGVGYDFRSGYDVSETVVPVRDSVGRHIGTAVLAVKEDGLWAEVAFDYSSPERLDAELGKLYALPHGKLHLPTQTVPVCLDAEDGPATFPLFRVTRISMSGVVLTSRTQYSAYDPVEIVEGD